MVSSPKRGILAAVNESFSKSLDQLVEPSKILVISTSFSRQEGVEAVVKVIIPLRVQTISPPPGRIDDTNIVQIALANHHHMSIQSLCLMMNGLA